jgi:hypothetical protein
MVVSAYRQMLPGKNNEAAELSKTLRAWRTRRDKYPSSAIAPT